MPESKFTLPIRLSDRLFDSGGFLADNIFKTPGFVPRNALGEFFRFAF